MSRLRYAGLTGTVGSGNMTNSATSHTFTAALTYGAGATVPTLTGSDYFMLSILDTSGNLSEVVKVTAYNSGTAVATIARAQEGTTGVTHTSGDKVTLAAYPTDFGPTPVSFTGPNSGSDISTSSTTFVDLTGHTVSIAAVVGDVLEISFSGTHYGTTGTDRPQWTLAYNGTAAGPIIQHSVGSSSTAQSVAFTYQHTVVSGDISSGLVPIKIQWRRSSSGGSGPIFWGDSGGLVGHLNAKNLSH